jgi:hypothetical protein
MFELIFCQDFAGRFRRGTGSRFTDSPQLLCTRKCVSRDIFLARSCKKVAELDPDGSEKADGMKLVKVPLDRFFEILRPGQMTGTAARFMAMDYLRRFSENDAF